MANSVNHNGLLQAVTSGFTQFAQVSVLISARLKGLNSLIMAFVVCLQYCKITVDYINEQKIPWLDDIDAIPIWAFSVCI